MLGMGLLEETGTSLSAGGRGHRADTAATGDTAEIERKGEPYPGFSLLLFSNPLQVSASFSSKQARSQVTWEPGTHSQQVSSWWHTTNRDWSRKMICGQTGPGPTYVPDSLKMSKTKLFLFLKAQHYPQKPHHPPLFPTLTIAANNCPSQKLEYYPWLLSHPHSDNHHVVWSLSP